MKKRVSAGLGVAVIVYLVVQFLLPAPEQAPSSDPAADHNPQPADKIPDREEIVSVSPSGNQPSYFECQQFLFASRHHANTYWQQWRPEPWREKGYSNDAIATALYELGKAAEATAVAQPALVNTAPLNQIDREILQRVEAKIGTLPKGLRVGRDVPPPWLKEAIENNAPLQVPDERWSLVIDDIAWMIAQPQISNTQILTLLDKLDDPNALISDNTRHGNGVRLPDVAATAGRMQLLETLLDQGLTLTTENYIPTTLDRLLKYLSEQDYDFNSPDPDVFIPIIRNIRRLVSAGVPANLTYGPNGTILSSLDLPGLVIQGAKQELIQEAFDFNFSEIKLNTYTSNPYIDALVTKIEHAKSVHTNNELGNNWRLKQGTCKKRLEDIDKQLAEASISVSGLDEAKRQGTVPQLLKTNPIVQACRQAKAAQKAPFWQSDTEFGPLYKALKQGDRQAVTAFFNNHPEGIEWWFHHISVSYPKLYPTLIAEGFEPAQKDYQLYVRHNPTPDKFKQLQAHGADLGSKDKYGRSLLYVAVHNQSLPLLRYFEQQGVPWFTLKHGVDPLYLWLWNAVVLDKPEKVTDAVALMMERYTPVITKHHRGLMAVLQIKGPDIASQIVDDYPELAPDSASMPEITCTF